MATDFASKDCPGELPGYGRPVNYVPQTDAPDYVGPLLPNALINGSGHLQMLTTLREFAMMAWMDEVCSKPAWHVKVNNPEITNKWKAETLSRHSPDDFNEAMVDYCIAELKDRAKAVIDPQNPPPLLVFDAGVYRSDNAISEELKKEIQDAVTEFESRIPEHKKDWHPDSDEKVWDLVHPSLCPLVYGKSRILPKGTTTTLEDCVTLCGSGDVVPQPTNEEVIETTGSPIYSYRSPPKSITYSQRFQWLPCEVDIASSEPKITSYINNLHPVHEKKLYHIVERVLGAAIPLWELTLARLDEDLFQPKLRIECNGPEYDTTVLNKADGDKNGGNKEAADDADELEAEENGVDDADDDDWEDEDEEENRGTLLYPNPDPYAPRPVPQPLSFQTKYGQHGLQVIVKLANIQLTPEKPSYAGGSWHVEGQVNEHIVSTALYYYSNENITQSHLSFRHQVDQESASEDLSYDQDDHLFLTKYFGCANEEAAVQEIGSVKTDEGRLLTFPNILQHRVAPFELADPTKPGHRKIIALFLVDPNIKVISTANIPCQQMEWWWEIVRARGEELEERKAADGFAKLPAELKHLIQDELQGVSEFPFTMEAAKKFRLELMKERSAFVHEQTRAFEAETFSLCEH